MQGMIIGVPKEIKPEENRIAIIPGAVPRTATRALTLNTLPYVLQIADKGWERASKENRALAHGVTMVKGQITYQAVADACDLACVPLEEFLR